MVYKFKEGARLAKVDAQQAGELLEKLRGEHEGRLTPAQVVAAGRHRTSPIHRAFQWDNTIAADEFRLEQARSLIRSIVVCVEHAKHQPASEPRAFLCIQHQGDAEKTYTSIQVALSTPDLRRQVLQGAIQEARGWQSRYAHYTELTKVFAAIEQADRDLNSGASDAA